jgi:GNAT superfamily N-acetyltransferase
MDPGALLATTHEAGHGLRVRLRLTRPSDAARVQQFIDSLPPASRGVVRDLTFYDPRRRLVVAATAPIAGGEAVVGLADLDLLETGLAGVGLVVADDRRGQGVGKLLSEAAAALATRHGATHLKAELPEENTAMRRLMERLGPTVATAEGSGVTVYTRLPIGRRRAA